MPGQCGELPRGVNLVPVRFKVHEGCFPHFVTCTVAHWIPVFCRDDYFAILVDSLNYCSEHKGLSVHGCVLMPNHLHGVFSQADGHLCDVMRDLKRHTSKTVAQRLETDGRSLWLRAFTNAGRATGNIKVWMDEFHPEQVYSREFFEQKLSYLHDNPVRAGFVEDPCDWKYSSAGFYYREASSLIRIAVIEW